MSGVSVNTEKAPAAIGPYVQAMKTDSLVFVSGQLGIDMATGEMPESVEDQARASLSNLAAVLEAAGSSKQNVLKTIVFLTDINDFAMVNAVYADFFEGANPARSAVAVAALPKGAKVEVECVASC